MSWRPDRQAIRDRWLTIRLVFDTSHGLTLAVVGCVVLGALLPLLFTLSTGAAANAVGPAVTGGLSSAAGDRLIRAVVVVGVLFVVQQTLSPVREGGLVQSRGPEDNLAEARRMIAACPPA